MSLSDFVDEATCTHADPFLFQQYHIDLALPALQHCGLCPFWEECESLVKPKSSYYDGVAGGKVWRNGKVIARLDPDEPNRLIVGEEESEFDIDSLSEQDDMNSIPI